MQGSSGVSQDGEPVEVKVVEQGVSSEVFGENGVVDAAVGGEGAEGGVGCWEIHKAALLKHFETLLPAYLGPCA